MLPPFPADRLTSFNFRRFFGVVSLLLVLIVATSINNAELRLRTRFPQGTAIQKKPPQRILAKLSLVKAGQQERYGTKNLFRRRREVT